MSLFAELKRRNVIKVGAAYLALAWLVLQLTSIVVPEFGLPAWTMRLVIWFGVIGFPFVLIFSWAYELTPEGLKRESEVDRSQSITHVTSKRLDYIIIGLMVLAMLMFAADRFIPRSSAPDAPVASTAVEAAEIVATPEAGSIATAPPAAAPVPVQPPAPAPSEKSIAVLPFVDMSQAGDQAYFSDGIAEELLNLLAKIPELKVIARTSSFAFKGKEADIADIAKKLNVAHVLEGSVRKSGNTIRITAQLVRAIDSVHLWSETWDRPLDDIFAVQDEIAGAVVTQLKIKLLGDAPKAQKVDPEAYTLGLKAYQLDLQYTQAGITQAIELYQQALAIDPTFTWAWVFLAGDYSAQAFLGHGPRSADENFRLAREALGQALAIEPDFAPAHALLGWISMRYDDDLPAAARHVEHALALAPSNPFVVSYASELAVALGRLDTAIEISEFVTNWDPVNPSRHIWAGDVFRRAGRMEEAMSSFRFAHSLGPARIQAQYGLAFVLLHQGDPESALTAIQTEAGEGWRLTGLALINHALGRQAESDAALAELVEKHQKSWSSSVAWVHAYRGDADAAFEWMEKAVLNGDTGVMSFPTEPLLASLHNDPRWLPFLRKIGKAPEQLAAIKFDVKVPE